MKKKYRSLFSFLLILIILILLVDSVSYAETTRALEPGGLVERIRLENQEPENFVFSIRLLMILTVLSLAPSILIMVTSFTRVLIVLSFIRSAIGLQQTPPNQVIIGLSLNYLF